MNLDELYKEYGELMVQQEIQTNKIRMVKSQIADLLSKPKKEEDDKDEVQ